MSSFSHNERGSISGFVVVLSMTFVACAGLAFDGGRMIAARVEATDAAENAARAGAQHVTSLRSGNPSIDRPTAVVSANRFLACRKADALDPRHAPASDHLNRNIGLFQHAVGNRILDHARQRVLTRRAHHNLAGTQAPRSC